MRPDVGEDGSALSYHGGNINAARLRFPRAPEPWLDLSTGINPHAYPFAATEMQQLTRLPDAADVVALQGAAAQAYGVADPACVAAFPGTQMLISLLPYVLAHPGADVAVLSPTYGEHEAAWRLAGHDVRPVASLEALAGVAIGVVCNPNNPDGRRHDPAVLRALAQRMRLLIVDEAFVDLEPPGLSLAGEIGPSLLILRSFGKTYGLAGVRLGFALTEPARAARLRAAIGPWAISGPALAAGLQALPDAGWRGLMIERLDAETARLDALAQSAGLAVLGGTRLFRLYHTAHAACVYQRLGEAGVLVRRFAGQPEHLRFGLPASESEWARLEHALQA